MMEAVPLKHRLTIILHDSKSQKTILNFILNFVSTIIFFRRYYMYTTDIEIYL